MNSVRIPLAAIVVVAALAATLQAKGPTVRLSITGSDFEPLDITDSRILSASNVFEGLFLGSPCNEPSRAYPRYRVTFFVEPPAWMKRTVEARYALTYVKDPATGLGFIYLPGRGDDEYRLNVGTMMREGQDGRWLRASPDWASRMSRFLP